MSTFTFTSTEGRFLEELRDNLSSNENLRLHFEGALCAEKRFNLVFITIPKNLKLKPKCSERIQERVLNGDIIADVNKLTKYEKQLDKNGNLIVDFDAYVLSIKGDKVQVLLPESYRRKKDDTFSMEGYNKEEQTLTIHTEHQFLLEMLESCLDNNPIIEACGILSDFEESKVTITLPANFRVKTADGGTVSIFGSGVKLATINELPGWREQSKQKSAGHLYANFKAVITNISGSKFTIQLPEWYNDSYIPVSTTEKFNRITKKVSEEQAFAAIRFMNEQYKYMGFPPFNGIAYDTEVFDMGSGKFDPEVLEDLDMEDIDGINRCIRDAYFNTMGIITSRFGQKSHDYIWADWDIYGYKDVTEVPLSIASEITDDSTICIEFFKGKESLELFLKRDDISEYTANRPILIERLKRIEERKAQRKRP